MNLDQLPGILAALVLVGGGIAFLFWWLGRSNKLAAERRQEEARLRQHLEVDASDKEVLLALVDGQTELLAQQKTQTRHLGTISTAVQIVAVLLVLSAIGGCLLALVGGTLALP